MTFHKDLTGANLHEPKGVSTAAVNQVYRADGSGSGSWQDVVIPPGTFTVTSAEFTSTGTWTKPANLFGCMVYLIGGGGSSGNDFSNGNPGNATTFKTLSAAGGKGSGTGGGDAGGIATGGFARFDGSTYTPSTSSGGVTTNFGLRGISNGPYGYYATGAEHGALRGCGASIVGGGGGAAIIGWLDTSALSATETVTVGTGGPNPGGGTGAAGFAGYAMIVQYIKN